MDSITQAVLGATIQGAILGKVQGRRALLYGAALGTLPDLDVLIRYADPVSSMTHHRGFSHSVFVLTGLAAMLAWLVRQRWPDAPYSGRRLFLALWLVLVTHPVLDAFTVYGTQLFWPLSFTPQSWAAIFIIDPLYTLPMLAAVLHAAVRGMAHGRSVTLMACTLAFGCAYLGLGLGGRLLVERQARAALQEAGIAVTALRAVPVTVNVFIWRVIAKSEGGQQLEALSSLFDRGRPQWSSQPLNLAAARALDGVALHERLRWFTGDWLRYDVIGNALVVSDLRMGLPGRYIFRFKMAQCDGAGQWRAVMPTSWPGRSPTLDDMKPILRRIFRQEPALPLSSWAGAYAQRSLPHSAGCALPGGSGVTTSETTNNRPS